MFEVLDLIFFRGTDLNCEPIRLWIFHGIRVQTEWGLIGLVSLDMEQRLFAMIDLVVDDAGTTNDKIVIQGRWFFPGQML